MRRVWHDHGLGIVLVSLFVAMSVSTLFTGYAEYQSEELDHGQVFTWSGFWLWWTFEYTMSLVADVFGAMLLVMLTKRLNERGSAES